MNNEFYYKGYKIEMFPTEMQKEFIDRCIELNRYIYNWTIEQEEKQFELFSKGKSDIRFLSWFDLGKIFTNFRRENDWLKEVPYSSIKYTIKYAVNAYNHFFKGIFKRPKFKSKKRSKQSFSLRSERFYFENNMVRIEGLPAGDKIYTKWKSGFSKKNKIKFINPTVSKDNIGRYFISFALETKKPLEYLNCTSKSEVLGIDLNVKKRFVLSTGEIFNAPDTNKIVKKQKRLQRKFQKDIDRLKKLERINPDKDIHMSNRANKRKKRLLNAFKKEANINKTFHYTTIKNIISRNPKAIVIEDLNVADMQQTSYISKYTARVAFGEIRRIIEQKCNVYGIPLILAPRTFESSQICSYCGNKRKIGGAKVYKCPICGNIIDRDINAAINLEKLAYT